MLSKHQDHPSVYPMILKLPITRGNITPIPKEATEEKEKEKLKIENNENKKRENQKNIENANETQQPQEGRSKQTLQDAPG